MPAAALGWSRHAKPASVVSTENQLHILTTFPYRGAVVISPHHAVEGQDEAALCVLLRRRAIAAVPARLQVREPRERVVEHRR